MRHNNDNDKLPSTWIGAKAIGVKRYFTGIPCVNGHVAPRYTSGRSCVVCINERAMERYSANPEAHHERSREWEKINIERARELCRIRLAKYRKEDPDRFREYSRARRESKPEEHRNNNRNRKARIRGAGGKHTVDDVEQILKLQNYRCAECGTSVRKRENRHIDHIMPIALGGSNWPSNLQVLCPPCNLHKAAKDPIEFARKKGRLL